MPKGKYPRKPAIERFMSFVEVQDNGCWYWTGNLNTDGYGVFSFGNKSVRAHRASFEFFRGPIPEGLQIDHQCHDPKVCSGGVNCPHRRCVNPNHIEPATVIQNRSEARGRTNTPPAIAASLAERRARTACRNGHEYNADNTRIDPKSGWRCCRICNTARAREKRERNRT